MDGLSASLFTEDVVKFALGIAFITLVVFIVWLLLREMRLWYWRINSLLNNLKHIEKRISCLEHKMNDIFQEITIINQNMIKVADLLDKAVINDNQHNKIGEDNKEEEDIIAQRIKD